MNSVQRYLSVCRMTRDAGWLLRSASSPTKYMRPWSIVLKRFAASQMLHPNRRTPVRPPLYSTISKWPDEMIAKRLSTVYRMLATADDKQIPVLNRCIELLFTEQVRRDLCHATLRKPK